MQRALAVAQLHRADGHAFHHAGVVGQLDRIADGDGILDHDEQAGDQILHQALGAEADGQADHAGAGQQRRDVDTQVGQHRNHGDDQQPHERRVAHQRQDGLGAQARLLAAPVARCEGLGDGGVDQQPDQPRQQHHPDHAEDRFGDMPAQRGGIRQADDRRIPDTRHQLDERHPDDDPHQRNAEAGKALDIGRAPAVPQARGAHRGLGRAARHQGQQQRRHEQCHGEHGAAQELVGVPGSHDGADHGGQHHGQHRQIPGVPGQAQQVHDGRVGLPECQRPQRNQLADGTAETHREEGNQDGGEDVGEGADECGEIDAQRGHHAGIGAGLAQRGQRTGYEEQPRRVLEQVSHGVRAVRGVEQREDHLARGGHNRAGHDRIRHHHAAHAGGRTAVDLVREQYGHRECHDPRPDPAQEIDADVYP
ncbi:hypothetical protein D3C86_1248560 [compost metagenome]